MPQNPSLEYYFSNPCFLLTEKSFYFSKYSFWFIATVTLFVLLMFSTLYRPTCFFKLLFWTLNCSQKKSDKSSLFKAFDLVNTSKIMFLAVFLLIEHESLQNKNKNREALSVSLRFWNKKHFWIWFFFVNIFNSVIWKHKDID